MSPRERMMAMVIGGGLALVVGWQSVSFLFFKQIKKADASIQSLQKKIGEHDRVIKKGKAMRKVWRDYAARSFATEEMVVLNAFDSELKALVSKHGLTRATHGRTRSLIGRKTDISAVGFQIQGAVGEYSDAIAMLLDLYDTPYLCRVTKVSIAPLDPRATGRLVKMDLTVETPVLPVFKRREAEALGIKPADMKTIEELGEMPGGPARDLGVPPNKYVILADKNIFRRYVPPPTNILAIDNQDWDPVLVTVRVFWEGKRQEGQPPWSVGSRSRSDSPSFEGDAVEVFVLYSDGTKFGPKRFDGGVSQPWVFRVDEYHDAPPPEEIWLAVHNQHDGDVYVQVTVTDGQGKKTVKPEVRVKAKQQLDIDRYQDVVSVAVKATYDDGKDGPTATYMPKADKQTFIVMGPSAVPIPTGPATDPAADANLTVTALMTYPGVHEMIATNSGSQARIIFATGQTVDQKGKLLAVHPLGGVVHFDETDHTYLYPVGKPFADRVLLEVGSEPSQQEVMEAIEAWAEGVALANSQ